MFYAVDGIKLKFKGYREKWRICSHTIFGSKSKTQILDMSANTPVRRNNQTKFDLKPSIVFEFGYLITTRVPAAPSTDEITDLNIFGCFWKFTAFINFSASHAKYYYSVNPKLAKPCSPGCQNAVMKLVRLQAMRFPSSWRCRCWWCSDPRNDDPGAPIEGGITWRPPKPTSNSLQT